jgi:hypothetical protein
VSTKEVRNWGFTVILVYNDYPSTGDIKAEAVVDRWYLIRGRLEIRVFKRMVIKE